MKLALSHLSIRLVCSFLLLANLLLCMKSPTTATAVGYESDRLALLHLKHTIIRDPLGALSSWNNSFHYCEWRGITCGRGHRRVTILNLNSQSLVGTLSPYIGNLTFLRVIDLQNNSFHGEIPQDIGRLFRLHSISLSNNSFGGEIPANISHCSNLINLCIGSNNLQGKIPPELGSLSKLKYINFRLNNLIGTIPPSLGNLSSLEDLSLLFNNLEGSIPDSLGQMKKLKSFRVAANKLSGTIPPSLWNLSSLYQFYVIQNQLHGSLPSDIGLTLPLLENFGIAANQFSGSIPSSLSNGSVLENIDISENNFVGVIPTDLSGLRNLKWLNFDGNRLGGGGIKDLSFITSLTNCRNLEMLQLEDNHFGGVLPNSIANLSTKLNALALGGNQISGSIPSGIENLANLQLLFMGRNLLTGIIPVSIGKLHKLRRLILHGNKLSGLLPSSLGNISQLYELRLEDNKLIGTIPLSLVKYQHLQILDLSRNYLSGIIQKQVIGSFSFLTYLNLSHNSFTGSLPLEVGNMKNLGVLDISENKLSGEIPYTLQDCLTLERLYMEGNLLEGNIPPLLTTLKAIQDLDLSRNNLFGRIPKYLESFHLLRYLNLSFNQFEGELPTVGVFRNVTAVSVTGNNKLCGGIPELQLPGCSNQELVKRGKSLFKIMIMVAGVFVGLILIISSLICYWRRRKSRKRPSILSLRNGYLRVSYGELLKCTGGFASANLLGTGSFGFVYKGILHQYERPVAVKVLNLQQEGASKSFMIECEALRKIRHRNLLKIITSCSSVDFKGNDFKALVYEFMPKGSLDKWLHPKEVVDGEHELRNLNLTQRLNIATDVASALEYLHCHCQATIAHSDLKPSNVLLDDNMTAHVGDFGLAKTISSISSNAGENQTSSMVIKGSIGYVAPEYGMGGEVSTPGDVYSYGILLLEMFTGKRPTDDMFKDGLSLHNFVEMALPERVMEIVDPRLLLEKDTRGNMLECLVSAMRIGIACSRESPRDRMEMEDVVMELHLVRDVYHWEGVNGERINEAQIA